MPAKKIVANASSASYKSDSRRLPTPGTTAVAAGASGSTGEADYWLAELAAGTGAGADGDGPGDCGATAGSVAGSAGVLGAAAGGLRGALPSLRRSCSGRRLYSSHCLVRPC